MVRAKKGQCDLGSRQPGRDEMLHDRSHIVPTKIIAAEDVADGNAAAAGEPLRNVCGSAARTWGGAETDEMARSANR